MQYLKCFLRTKIHLLCFKYKLPKPKSLLFSHSTPFLNLNKAYSHPLFFPNPLNLSFYLYPHPPSMVDNKNKRMKSIGHISTSPKMKSKKEKEPTKGGLSNRGKHLAHSPLPPQMLHLPMCMAGGGCTACSCCERLLRVAVRVSKVLARSLFWANITS